jgi:hypothetical protein
MPSRRTNILILQSGGPSDTTAPTCTITCAQSPGPTATSPLNYTITFSESVTGFVVGDFTIVGGTKGALGGSGAVYTCDVTPDSPSITVTADVSAGVCIDAAGNGNTAAPQVSIHYTSLTTGLTSYWKLEESALNNRLDSVGSRALVPVNAVAQAAGGKFGNAAEFLSADSARLTQEADVSLTAIDWSLGFTVCGWLYIPTTYASRSTVLSKGDTGGNNDWGLYTDNVSSPRMQVQDSVSGVSIAITAGALSVDTWYFFAGRYNPSTKKAEFSINGGSWSLGSALTNVPKNSYTRLHINRWGSSYGNSRVDEVGLWTRYLSDNEVLALYNGGTGIQHPF